MADRRRCTAPLAGPGRGHQTLRVTPEIEAGLSDHVWSIEENCRLAGLPYSSTSPPTGGFGMVIRIIIVGAIIGGGDDSDEMGYGSNFETGTLLVGIGLAADLASLSINSTKLPRAVLKPPGPNTPEVRMISGRSR